MKEVHMKETVLITGAAGGIGYSLARAFARDCGALILVDRDGARLKQAGAKLQETYGAQVLCIEQDLSVDGAAQRVFDAVKGRGLAVDILVNNAGFGDFGRFLDLDYQRERSLAGVNMIALMHMTHLFGNEMVRRGGGRILNLSSIAAWQPGPYMPMYYASKAFVFSFSQALSYELKGTGVSVTCLCPGPTSTGFEQNAQMKNSKMFTAFHPKSPDDVAREGYRAVMKGKPLHIPFLSLKGLKFLLRLAPERLKCRVAMWINVGSER